MAKDEPGSGTFAPGLVAERMGQVDPEFPGN